MSGVVVVRRKYDEVRSLSKIKKSYHGVAKIILFFHLLFSSLLQYFLVFVGVYIEAKNQMSRFSESSC